MTVTPGHRQRIKQELRQAGTTSYGLLKDESRYLPNLVKENEHIEATVYGRYFRGSCMLIATNTRILFLDKKPLFTFFDEITYNIVSGVACSTQGYFSSVTLHTRLIDYHVRLANRTCAAKFVDYIEWRSTQENSPPGSLSPPHQLPTNTRLSDKEMAFLAAHSLGTLSTADRNGRVHGSVVRYYVENNGSIYILIRPNSTKAAHIFAHRYVALTVYDEQTMQTLQLHGTAEAETDPVHKKHIISMLRNGSIALHHFVRRLSHVIYL